MTLPATLVGTSHGTLQRYRFNQIICGCARVAAGAVDRIGLDVADHSVALARILAELGTGELSRVDAVGHRVVHGGALHDQAGAVVTFVAVPGMTAEWLRRVVDCHLARDAALGHDAGVAI